MAPVLPSKGTPTQALALCGSGRRYYQRCARAQWPDIKGCEPVVRRDAPRGGNVAKGQVHSVRQEGEELPQEHPQYVSISKLQATVCLARFHWLTSSSLQSCPSGLVSASVSTLPVSKRSLTPPHMYYTSEIRLWWGICRSEKQHMDYRSFGFLESQRGLSEQDGGLQCSIITPALRSGFQFKCILTTLLHSSKPECQGCDLSDVGNFPRVW